MTKLPHASSTLSSFAAAVFAVGMTWLNPAHASCDAQQQIRLNVGDAQIDQWSGTSNAIRAVTLPNGFKLGVKIEETSREKYEEWLKREKGANQTEMVRISLYDITGTAPRLITYTWGGTNGRQGYGPRGGAARVDEVGNPGILFTLNKPNCSGTGERVQLTPEMIAKLPTAAMLNQVDEKPQPSAENLRGRDAALADIKAGNHRMVYPDHALSSDEMMVIKREFEKAGLQFALESELGNNSRGFKKGYAVAMMDAIEEKLGRPKMREIENNVKAGMAALKTTAPQ